ncbi:murein L,D-transpeptidase catalytic domain family protein [Fibrella sp. USSR17]
MKYISCLFVLIFGCTSLETKTTAQPDAPLPKVRVTGTLFATLGLDTLGLNQSVFDLALRGMKLVPKKKPYLLIADMTQPSSAKRLYVLDLEKKEVLLRTYVAHGRNSGGLMATQFSNATNSNQTSLGFYRVMGRYHGKHGLSLKLKGLEKGFNDNVFARNIVLHGADYVSEDTVRVRGQLGHSEGCPAIPNAITKLILGKVEGGGCLFVYYPDPTYLAASSFVNATVTN